MTTSRSALVPATPGDEAEFVAAVTASQGLLRPWIDAADTPERYAAMLARRDTSEFHPFLVRARDSGVLAGAINVSGVIRGPFLSAFVGYWAFSGSERRGYMTDGLCALVHHAFTELGLHRLEANIQPANLASIALAERCGFRYEGFSPNYLQVFGEWKDHNRYAITNDG
jgi:ribosomal-protein-alanine N-acetyltransferase